MAGNTIGLPAFGACPQGAGVPLHAGLVPTAVADQYVRTATAAGDRHHRHVIESVVGPHHVPGSGRDDRAGPGVRLHCGVRRSELVIRWRAWPRSASRPHASNPARGAVYRNCLCRPFRGSRRSRRYLSAIPERTRAQRRNTLPPNATRSPSMPSPVQLSAPSASSTALRCLASTNATYSCSSSLSRVGLLRWPNVTRSSMLCLSTGGSRGELLAQSVMAAVPASGDLVEAAASGALVALDARGHQTQALQLLQLGIDLAVRRAPVVEVDARVDPFLQVVARDFLFVGHHAQQCPTGGGKCRLPYPFSAGRVHAARLTTRSAKVAPATDR